MNTSESPANYSPAWRHRARSFDTARCIASLLACYSRLVRDYLKPTLPDFLLWDRLLAGIEVEWNLMVEKFSAVAAAVSEPDTPASTQDPDDRDGR